jgi:2-polyprenyl-3-methyl-5-hydroxy-6-metoxy-1,4-benzoquinol methylase
MKAQLQLSENELRPDKLRAAQHASFAADIRRLLERKAEFVAVPCPACGRSRGREDFEKYGYRYVVCLGCETMYVSPRPTPEILEMYYSTSENYAYWNQHIFPATEAVRREKIFRPRAQRLQEICERFGQRGGTLLEVGAGFGTFCEEASQLARFDRVVAVEPTPSLAETCRQRGLEVIEKPIESARSEIGEVSVVASFEVIEHLFSPRDFVRHCAAVLKPGGILLLTCPNVRGFDIALLQQVSDSVDVEHLNYFHPASLSALVTSCGFEVLEVQTPGKLDVELVRKKVLAGEFTVKSQPFLQRVLIDEWETLGAPFQRFLADSGLSSHMWLAARK